MKYTILTNETKVHNGENKMKTQRKIEEKTFDWKVAVFKKLLRKYSKYEDDKNAIANRALYEANEKYGLNGAWFEDSGAWEKARDLVL